LIFCCCASQKAMCNRILYYIERQCEKITTHSYFFEQYIIFEIIMY
jgi:hypothetical protein